LGFGPHPSPEYAAAKAGLIRFTSSLAALREAMGVRVNCVVPDWLATERVEKGPGGWQGKARRRRIGQHDMLAGPYRLEPGSFGMARYPYRQLRFGAGRIVDGE
jgi:NAD(P)-dependent dehydrogenase (short-subunit alcohol dehydrogenase family)